MNFEKIPRIWLIICGLVYLSGLFACLLLAPHAFTLGFGFGGALVLLNSWVSAWRIRKAEFRARIRVIASVVGGFYVRLLIVGAFIYWLIKYMAVDPVGLVTGLSVVPAGLFVMLILIYFANRRPGEV
ncbi:MAG TPA: ATP synthase subunit I [Desulfomonilaceae bacterium]|nr:ATP synthase subunit I [Desulfomonilaceae bacterium]